MRDISNNRYRYIVALIAGAIIALYCGIGSLFIAGAVQHGDRSVTVGSLIVMILAAFGGIGSIIFGVRGLKRA